MVIVLVASYVALWLLVLLLGFLLLGTLRTLGRIHWRLEQLEATTPRRVGRNGLTPGTKAPDFSLPSADGADVSLHDFAGRRRLLVFVQSGCPSCDHVVPALNRLQGQAELQVLVVNNSDQEAGRKWASEVAASFPVLFQEKWSLSRRYEVFAAPFAFLIDEQGRIVSKGIINNKQHIRFLLSGERAGVPIDETEAELAGVGAGE